MIYTSYIQSMEFVRYVKIPSYGNYTSFSEMAVVAIEDIQKDTEIGGMKGFGAKVKKDQLPQSSQFSYFKRLGINDMVMLGPASFINHNCEPNCEYICRGERNSTTIFMKTKRALVRGEELTVSYSDDYFEPGNVDCKCPSCASKKTTPIEVAAQLSPSAAATQEEDELPLSEELDVTAQISPPAAATPEEDQLPLPKKLEVAGQDSPRSSAATSASPMSNEFVGILPPSPPATPAKNEKKREKKVKTDDRVECFVCHSEVNRIDRHLVQRHSDIFGGRQRRFCLAFYRCRNAKTQRKFIYDCAKCFTRFASLVTHKHVNKCDCSTVVKVSNPESRSSLPAEIRAAAKSNFLPSSRDLDVAERFVQFQTDISKCSGDNRKWCLDRAGIVKLMAQMFNMTSSLRCPELLVKGCLEMKTAKNLKPQTMLNYLSIFKLFVDYCYLNKEIAKCDDGFDRMKAAISAARKAFSPTAALNANQASEKKLSLVPSNEQVRLRYRQVLDILATNMQQKTLSYRKQQALNFFLLQARINTRLVKLFFFVSSRNHIPLFFYYFYSKTHAVVFLLFLLRITSRCFFHCFYSKSYPVVFLLFLLDIIFRCFFIVSTPSHIPLFFSSVLLEITSRCFFSSFLLEITSRCFSHCFTRKHIPLFFSLFFTRNHIPLLNYCFYSKSHPVVFFIGSTRNHIPLFFFIVSTRNYIPLFFSLFLLENTSGCFFHCCLLENTSRCFFIVSTRNQIPLFFSSFLLEITSRCFSHCPNSKTHPGVLLLFLLQVTSRFFSLLLLEITSNLINV